MKFVQTIALSVLLVSTSLAVRLASGQTALNLANAEVIVRSSRNPSFVGMASTDSAGHFTVKGVPKGGINITVRRNNAVVATGAAIFAGGVLTDALATPLLVDPNRNHLKSGPGK